MFTTQPILSPKGLLAAMVATLLSGQALADTAGRVSFIFGDVSAVNTIDGSRRTLSKGDLVNSGERLETGKGRLQIRFTDGSFVSLQPNTVFGLDNYSFSKTKPEEGSLLFNFLRGGMRTVSGAIGKINRANYKIKTPVATIGIRGTGYAGSMNNGTLVISVSKGIVNLTNDFGSSNVPAGQTFQTQQGRAPEPAPEGVSAQARADSPDSGEQQEDRQERRDNTPIGGGLQISTTVIAAVDDAATDDTGTIITPPELGVLYPNSTITIDNNANPTTSQISPFYALTQAKVRTSTNFLSSSQLGATFNNTTGSERNALTAVDEVNANVDGTLFKNNVFTAGSLKTANVTTLGALSFGEWTNGTGTFDGQALTLSSSQFLPYIVGLQATDVNESQKVTYSLDKGSLARSNTTNLTGVLDHLNLDVNYAQGLIDVDMKVIFNGSDYIVNKTGIHRFQVDNSGGAELDGLLATSSTTANCAQGGCPTTLSIFFAGLNVANKVFGTQAGAAYIINLADDSTLSGVGALAASNTQVIAQRDPLNQIDGSKDTIYSASFVSNSPSFPLKSEASLTGKFDPTTGELLVASRPTGELYGRVDNEFSATTLNVGSFNKVLSWGQWHNGDLNNPSFPTGVTLNPTDDLHYIIGQTTTATDMANAAGSVRYSFVGGTSQAILDKFASFVAQTGSLDVDFTKATANVSMTFTGFDLGTFNNPAGFNTLTATGATTLTGTSALSFTGMTVNATDTRVNPNTLTCPTCTGTAMGGFAGTLTVSGAPQAVGLGYHISGTAMNAQTTTQTAFDVGGTQGFGNPVDPTL